METFIPPESVAKQARQALRWKEKGLDKGAGTPVGWARARQLADRKPVSLKTIRRIYSYLSRHAVDKQGKDFYNNRNPSKGRVMFAAWGSDAAFKWVKSILNKEDKKKEIASQESAKSIPENEALWQDCIKKAKEKFEIWPSRYATYYASNLYKEAGGKWKEGNEESLFPKPKLPENLSKSSWRRKLDNWAKEKGYKAIGKGQYGTVYYSEKNPNYVVKVFSDESYKVWYKIAKENQDNPHVPKFRGFPVKLVDGLWAVRIEKLSSLTSEDIRKISFIADWVAFHAKNSYGIATANLRSMIISPSKVDLIRKNYITDDLEQLLLDILLELSFYDNQAKYVIDLHSGNFMKRGETLVLIDPLAPLISKLRKSYGLKKPKYSNLDIFEKFRNSEQSESYKSFQEDEISNSLYDKRQSFTNDKSVKKVLIGSSKGPEFEVLYCETSRMFIPRFKDIK